MGEFKRSRLFTPGPLKFRESDYKRREARVDLETHAPDNLAVSDTRLIFQEKSSF
jgi:hypothetical protein